MKKKTPRRKFERFTRYYNKNKLVNQRQRKQNLWIIGWENKLKYENKKSSIL